MNKASVLIRKIIRGPMPVPKDYQTDWYIEGLLDNPQVINNALTEAEEILNELIAFGNGGTGFYMHKPGGLCHMIESSYLSELLRWFAPLLHGSYYFPRMHWDYSNNTVKNVKKSIIPRIKLMNEIINYLKFGI